MTLATKYLLEAIDHYPYDLPQTMEALDYALSYGDDQAHALLLKGRVFAEQLKDYITAIDYYEDALAADMYCLQIYPYYISSLISLEKYKEAFKLIDYTLTIKGIDKGVIYAKKALLYEYKHQYKKAIKTIKLAKTETYNSDYMNYLNEVNKRVKQKQKKQKKQ